MRAEEVKKQFEEVIVKTVGDEKDEQLIEDRDRGEEIISGAQQLQLSPFGTIQFEWPNPRLTIEGDRLYAQFKAKHLRQGDLLTEAQLKAYYGRPQTLELDGKEIIVGQGEWTKEQENKLEELPRDIDMGIETFNMIREELQQTQVKLEQKKGNKKLKDKISLLTGQAYDAYQKVIKIKLDLLEVQTLRLSLFSVSLEEQALLEKIQLFAPSCVKVVKDGQTTTLWDSKDIMLEEGDQGTIRLLSLFGLFLRGGDIRFFGESLDNLLP